MTRTRRSRAPQVRKHTATTDEGLPITVQVWGTSTNARVTVLVAGVLVARRTERGAGALARALAGAA